MSWPSSSVLKHLVKYAFYLSELIVLVSGQRFRAIQLNFMWPLLYRKRKKKRGISGNCSTRDEMKLKQKQTDNDKSKFNFKHLHYIFLLWLFLKHNHHQYNHLLRQINI